VQANESARFKILIVTDHVRVIVVCTNMQHVPERVRPAGKTEAVSGKVI